MKKASGKGEERPSDKRQRGEKKEVVRNKTRSHREKEARKSIGFFYAALKMSPHTAPDSLSKVSNSHKTN